MKTNGREWNLFPCVRHVSWLNRIVSASFQALQLTHGGGGSGASAFSVGSCDEEAADRTLNFEL